MSTASSTTTEPPAQPVIAGLGAVVLVGGAALLAADGWKLGALFLVGGLLGISLYHAAFGFTAAYRDAIVRRDVSGVVAQLVMLGAAMALFAPVLAEGRVFGHGVVGAVAPVGLQVAFGSLIFGLGMQLGGGCGSGTLYTVGGGSTRMVITLVAFCAGGLWGSLDMEFWAAAPRWRAVSLAAEFGWPLALALQFAVLGALWFGLRRWAGAAAQRPLWSRRLGWRDLARGPWPLLLGAGLLALLNWLTLLIAGHPWTVTWGFTLWGAKAAALLGWEPAASAFWSGGFPARAMAGGVFDDVTSVMNIGIVLGALTAAGLAGRFAPTRRIALRGALAAVIGGLAMGYGARLAFGCNIGAFFSGVASTSLHGWLWIVCALPGTWIGVRLRPLFGLPR